jgi:hypothetical protein
MKLLLKRIYFSPTYTIGKLFIDGKYFADTIEDVNRDLNKDGDLLDSGESKVYAQTCIPFGTYDVIVNRSPKMKRDLPRLLNVPHFEGILIHRGSSEKSSAGCIIIGENKVVGKVINSVKYEDALVAVLKHAQNGGEKITIEII